MQSSTQASNRVGHSAVVELFVHAGEKTFQPTHVSDIEIIFATPPELQEGPAQIEVRVDGVISTRAIQILPHASNAKRLPITSANLSQIATNAI